MGKAKKKSHDYFRGKMNKFEEATKLQQLKLEIALITTAQGSLEPLAPLWREVDLTFLYGLQCLKTFYLNHFLIQRVFLAVPSPKVNLLPVFVHYHIS